MKKLISLFFLSFIGLNVVAQCNVVAIQNISNVNGGIVYTLPKTVLDINIETTKTYKIAAPYAKYAKKYFNLNSSEIITSNSEFVEITQINIKEKGIADPNRTYFVKTKAASEANFIQTDEKGIIIGINTPIGKHKNQMICKHKMLEKEKFDLSFDKSDLNEDFFAADSNEKAVDIVASQIYNIRDSKTYLLSGSADYAPADGASLQFMLAELNKQEARLMQLFIGKTIKIAETKTIELSPKDNINKDILCYFSPQNGISDKDDVSAKPVYISLNANKKEFFQLEKKSFLKPETHGLFYCLPGSADIEISDAKKSYYKETVNIAQFGTTLSFPTRFLDKNKHVKILFDSATGAIKSINN